MFVPLVKTRDRGLAELVVALLQLQFPITDRNDQRFCIRGSSKQK